MHKELIESTTTLVKGLVKKADMVRLNLGSFLYLGKMASAIRTLIQAYAYTHKLNRIKINIDSF